MTKPLGMIRVLIVSHEQALRDSYCLVFQSAGRVVHAVAVEALPLTLKATHFDVLVMDHTLSEQERKAGVYIANTLVPKTLTLILHSSNDDSGADLALDSRAGIEVILSALEKLIEAGKSK